MSYLQLREGYPSYRCHGDDVLSLVTMAIKDVLAHCKNRLLSIQKQITCPDGHWKEKILFPAGSPASQARTIPLRQRVNLLLFP